MFIATVINFLLSSLKTGPVVAFFTALIRKALILDINYLLSEDGELINDASRNVNIVHSWASTLPVSMSVPDSVSIHIRWRYIFSDLIVIWRAWALFPDRQWVILIPFILWIGTVGE